MISLFFSLFIAFYFTFLSGVIFTKLAFGENYKLNFFEYGIYGIVFFGFISLFTNFFIPINKSLNSLLLIAIFLISLSHSNKIISKSILKYLILIVIFSFFTVVYDNNYRPDAGSYHLPYVSILNEYKIIFGLSNLHYRFGHTSIMQHVSSIYNNHLFGNEGIILPLIIIKANIIGHFFYKIFLSKIKDNALNYIFVSIILSFILIYNNRYSNLGNDAPAALCFFYLISKFFETDKKKIHNCINLFLVSTFIFLNKITMIFSFFVPLFYFKNYELKSLIKNKVIIFSFVFCSLFLTKNLINSGCLIFPVEQVCFKSLKWYDFNSDRRSNAVNAKIETEAWAKGWSDQKKQKKDFISYLEGSSWIEIWLKNHGVETLKRLTNFLIYFLILIIFLTVSFLKNNKKHKYNLSKKNNLLFFAFGISLIGTVFWFLNSPTFRYGYGYIITFFVLASLIIIRNKLNLFLIYFKNFNKIILIIVIFIFLKHSDRIINNYNTRTVIPNIYSDDNVMLYRKNYEILKNNKIFFYIPNKKYDVGMCYYSTPPCTHTYSDINPDELILDHFYNYKIYYYKN